MISACDVYATNVHDSILKTKHKLVHIFPVGSKQINNTSSRANITIYDTRAHNIDNCASFVVLTIVSMMRLRMSILHL